MELGWTIVAAVFGGVWAVLMMARDQNARVIAETSDIMMRLLDADHLIIEHPEIQKYLSRTSQEPGDFFRETARLDEDLFFKSKSLIYSQLNLFDSILSAATHSKSGFFAVRTPAILDPADWARYIQFTMTHPLCQSIMLHEGTNFGEALQQFWNRDKEVIQKNKADRFAW
jgi:hypothetical protein